MAAPTRRLGRTNLQVGSFGLGTFQITPDFDVAEDEALAILDLAADAGIGLIDTAPMYGDGSSEVLVGQALRNRPDWRPVVSSKVGHFGPEPGPYRDPAVIRRSVETSRERLGVERIDILMIHEPDWPQWGLTPDGGGLVTDVLEELKAEGRIGHVGAGGWDTKQIAAMVEGGRIDVVLVAGGVTLLDQPLRTDVLPAAARQDVGVIAAAAFGQGLPWLLSVQRREIEQRLERDDYASEHDKYPLDRPRAERLLRLYALAEETGLTMTQLTMRYILSIPGIHCHVPGARAVAHLRDNLDAVAQGPLPADIVARIEQR